MTHAWGQKIGITSLSCEITRASRGAVCTLDVPAGLVAGGTVALVLGAAGVYIAREDLKG